MLVSVMARNHTSATARAKRAGAKSMCYLAGTTSNELAIDQPNHQILKSPIKQNVVRFPPYIRTLHAHAQIHCVRVCVCVPCVRNGEAQICAISIRLSTVSAAATDPVECVFRFSHLLNRESSMCLFIVSATVEMAVVDAAAGKTITCVLYTHTYCVVHFVYPFTWDARLQARGLKFQRQHNNSWAPRNIVSQS